MVSVTVNIPRCQGCGRCVEICPAGALELTEAVKGATSVAVREAKCCACNACVVKCPHQAIRVIGYEMLKVEPPPDYPPEEGRYLRGNDYSPVAVVAILDTADEKIPAELMKLVSAALEAGAALAGTLQTENLGIEKIVANVVANPNIRFLVVCWREAEGHRPAEALSCLVENGVADDKRRTIIGATAQTPYLPNISLAAIQRFRQQISIVNLIRETDPPFGMRAANVQAAVHACIQETPTAFEEFVLFDPGAWPEPPICEKLTLRLTEPWRQELSEAEVKTLEAMKHAARKQSADPSVYRSWKRSKQQDDEQLLEFLGLKKKKDQNSEDQ